MARTRKIADIMRLPVLDDASNFHNYTPDSGETLTYTNCGLRKHTLALDSMYREEEMWTPDICRISKEFVSVLGEVTDEFYGDINDFDLWFLGKVNRSEQFFVLYYPNPNLLSEMAYRVTEVYVPFGFTLELADNAFQTVRFRQNADMTWSLVD